MAATIDDSRIIAYVEADLTRGTVNPKRVICTQYDAEMRVIAVRLKQNGKDWEIPAGYSVNVRMRKADGTSVYNPQQGAGNVAYVTLSAQMCGVEGVQKFVVEIVSGSDVAQTVPIELRVIKNPIEDQDFTSEDEKETIQQAVKDAQDAAEESQENANQAYTWNQNCITIYHQTENLKNDTQTLHDQAQAAATTAQTLAAQVEDYAEKVLGISVPAVALSQSEYDALNPPDPKTIYIVESDGPQNSLVANYPLTQNLSDGMDGSKTATAIGCRGLGDWDGTGLSFNTAPASGAVGQHQNYITLPSNLLSGMSFAGGITLALDLKPNTTAAAGNGDWTRLINLYKHGNSPTGTAEGELYVTQGLIATAYYDNVTAQYLDVSKAGLITAGAWHTVALTLGGGYLSVYLDGVLIGQQPDTTGLLSQLANVDANEIGNSRFADNDYAGLVRNFRIYDKALSAAEIGQLGQEATWKLYYGAAQDSTLTQLQEAVAELTGSLSDAQDDIQQAQNDLSALQSDVEKIENGTTNLPYLKTSGGTMAGNVDMDGNALTGLPDPAEDSDAVPKGWADGQYSPLTAAIRPTVTGNPITVTDSAEAPVQGLCVYGRTEQMTTTGAQLLPNTRGACEMAGVSYAPTGDGGVKIAGTSTGYSQCADSQSFTLEPGEYFLSISGPNKNVEAQLRDVSGTTLYVSSKSAKSISFQTATEVVYRTVFSPSSIPENANGTYYPMLNAGSTALPWEPYTGGKPSPSPEYPQELVSAGDVSVTLSDGGDGSQTLTLTGDLPGIPVDSGGNYTDPDGQQWVCNYRDWARGVDVQMVHLLNCSGYVSSLQRSSSPNNNAYYFTVKNSDRNPKPLATNSETGNTNYVLSEYFTAENVYAKNIIGIDISNISDTVFNVRFGFGSGMQILEDAKSWLTSNTVHALYPIATPIETPIPAEELAAYKALQTYDGTTNVMATDGAGLSLRYVADTQKYIDNKIAAISAAMLEG